jgi:hypothetical protein
VILVDLTAFQCDVVYEPDDAFIEAAREVAFNCDGAVIVAADGTIQEQMVRVRSPSSAELSEIDTLTYAN